MPLGTDVAPWPTAQAGEADLVRFVRLLHPGDTQAFEDGCTEAVALPLRSLMDEALVGDEPVVGVDREHPVR